MKFGVFLSDGDIIDGDVKKAVRRSQELEEAGFYSVSLNDHFYSPLGKPESNQLECLTAFSAIAQATNTIKLVPAVISASFRNPALLAKMIAMIDQISDGRFITGLGAGWQDKEYTAHGYQFPSLKTRLEQLNEVIQVINEMSQKVNPSFEGKYHKIKGAYNNPKPAQAKIPLMLGGSGTGLLKIASKEADILNIIPPTGNGKDFINDKEATLRFTMDVLKERIKILHDMLKNEGRSIADIEIGGLLLLGISKRPNDPELVGLAKQLGFNDLQTAQKAPVSLLGTPDEVVEEISKRFKETSMSYFIFVNGTKHTESLFINEVMPHFS